MCGIIFTGVRGEVNDDLEEEARRDPMLTRVEEVNRGWDRGGEEPVVDTYSVIVRRDGVTVSDVSGFV